MTGEQIRQLRKSLGLSQQAFATKLGVSTPTVSLWETSKTKPSPLAILQLKALESEK